jgi:Asp-tRNA(Asn)/Glu-tRNA(Gln) amidotransferase A subunit family amidase
VVGFKPSYGRISQRGLIPACYALDHVGLLTHDANDLPALYAALNDIDVLDRYQQAYPVTEVLRAPRLAALQNPLNYGLDLGVATHFADTLVKLSATYSINTQIDFLDYDFAKMRRAGLLATESDMAAFHAEGLRKKPHLFSDQLRAMLHYAAGKSAPDLALVHHRMQAAKLKANAVFAECDILLTPTTPQLAFRFGSKVPSNQADLTSFANLAGCPAISLPSGLIDGLPVGLQLIAAPGRDQTLMSMAIALQSTLQASPHG